MMIDDNYVFHSQKDIVHLGGAASQGYLWKQSGGTKTADGRAKQSLGSKRRKWSRRWFVLVEGARPLGWKESCFCRGWSDHADSDQIRAAS